jgi:hypothetical protein
VIDMGISYSRKVYGFTEVVGETVNSTVRPAGVLLVNEGSVQAGRIRRYRVYGRNTIIYEFLRVDFPVAQNLVAGVTPVESRGLTYNSNVNDNNINTTFTTGALSLGLYWFTWDLGSVRYVYVKFGGFASSSSVIVHRIDVSLDNVTYFTVGGGGWAPTSLGYVVGVGYCRYIRWVIDVRTANHIYTFADIGVIDLEATPYLVEKLSVSDYGLIEKEVKTYNRPINIAVFSDESWLYYCYDLSRVRITLTEGEVLF